MKLNVNISNINLNYYYDTLKSCIAKTKFEEHCMMSRQANRPSSCSEMNHHLVDVSKRVWWKDTALAERRRGNAGAYRHRVIITFDVNYQANHVDGHVSLFFFFKKKN